LYRLETLPDSEAQQIPRIVAQTLQAESIDDAKIAAIRVLGTRSRLMAVRPEYDIKTQYRAQLLTSFTRISVQQRAPSLWREAVYTPEIDKLLAEVALHDKSLAVADMAARTIGQMRSLSAVRYLAEQQRAGVKGALHALALVRDEAPSLPPVVDERSRVYAWLANTWRRISDQSMSIVWRFLFALIGAWLGIGTSVYLTYRNPAILHPMRMGSALGFGLIFGVIMALLVVLAGEIPWRLRGFWTWWMRLFASTMFGLMLGVLAWSAYSYLFLYATPDWDLMIFGGVALAFGLIVSSLFNIRGWGTLGLIAASFFLSIYLPYFNYCRQLYICIDAPPFSYTSYPLFGLLLGAATAWVGRAQNPNAPRAFTFSVSWASWVKLAVSGALGIVWTCVIWFAYGQAVSVPPLFWQTFSALFVGSAIIGIVATGVFGRKEKWTFYSGAVLSFAAAALQWDGIFQDLPLFPMPNESPASLLYYDFFEQIFTIGLPVALMIALGTHARTVFGDVMRFVGVTAADRERPEALTTYLILMLVCSGAALFVALFSMPSLLSMGIVLAGSGLPMLFSNPFTAIGALIVGVVSIALACFHVLWAGGTLLAALGVWRWKRWGVYGLIVSLAFFAVYRAVLTWQFLQTPVPNGASELVTPSLSVGDVILLLGAVGLLVVGVYLLRGHLAHMNWTVGTPQKRKTQTGTAAPVPPTPAPAAVEQQVMPIVPSVDTTTRQLPTEMSRQEDE
jgi:hypothetical protein